jgi:hypothetical protein
VKDFIRYAGIDPLLVKPSACQGQDLIHFGGLHRQSRNSQKLGLIDAD